MEVCQTIDRIYIYKGLLESGAFGVEELASTVWYRLALMLFHALQIVAQVSRNHLSLT